MKHLVDRFNFLDRQYAHIPHGRGRIYETERASRLFVQMEMFYLAQAICSQGAPIVQETLNNARRAVMEQITTGPADIGGQVSINRATRQLSWTDFQITPEFSIDPSVSGKFVSRSAIKTLTQAHKDQIRMVLQIVHRTLKEDR